MEYNTLQAKVNNLDTQKSQVDAAINLLQQFVATGFVTQEEDGSFIMPGVSGDRKFKPYESQQ